MIDTHAHLHMDAFAADRSRVLTRSFAVGVSGIVEVSIGRRSWPAVLSLAAADPRIVATIGIHPHEAVPAALNEIAHLAPQADHPDVVAIGETGIDLVRSRTRLEDQQVVFRAQVGIAREMALPLVIHCREAFAEVFRILDAESRGQVRGVFHCFTGGKAEALEVVKRGFLIGLGGGVTYGPDRWRSILEAIPGEAILLETDSPYLRPAPERHGRNEPGHIFATAQVVAGLLKIGIGALETLADRNAARLFDRSFGAARRTAGED